MRSSNGPVRPPAVAQQVGLGARASLPIAGVPARAWIGCRDEHEASREHQRPLAANDRHVAVFERLTQSVQARAGELRQLIEKQHAPIGERRLTRSRRSASADQPGGGDRVVGRPERATGDQAAMVQARHAVDPGHRQRLVLGHRRPGSRAGVEPASFSRSPAVPRATGDDRLRRPPRERRQPLGCPRTSRRSGIGPARIRPACSGISSGSGGSAPPASSAAAARRVVTPATSTPGTSAASRARWRGTISRCRPARRVPSATASAPGESRNSPPSDSSPNTA